MATPRQELEQLRVLAAQQGAQQPAPIVQAAPASQPALTPRQELEQLRLQAQGVQNGIMADNTAVGVDIAPNLAEELSFMEKTKAEILGRTEAGFEPLRTVVTGAIAEPVAGLAGIAALPLGATEPKEIVERTREALTAQPTKPEAVEALAEFGETLAPVGEAFQATETFLGDAAFDITGSPAVAALAKALPTAVLEVIGGIGALKQSTKTGGRLRGPGREAFNVTEKQINRALVESAPDVDVIKNASRSIYKEIDDIGVTVNPQAFGKFINKVIKRTKKERVNPRRTPKAAGAVEEFKAELKNLKGKTISDFDDLRKVAQDAASSLEPADARIGNIMLDEIDSFMDAIESTAFKGVKAKEAAGIGNKFRAARKLWGRARRAELIQEAMSKADLQASGFENGIRTQLRQIINNKKRSRFFTKDEISAMTDVVKGTNEQNILKLVGRLGFSEGQATNIVGGLGGTAVLGPAAPVLGQISRKLAQKATARGVKIADAVIKAGPDGRRIVSAYMKTTPKAQRNMFDLGQILLDQGADIDDLLKAADKVTREAAEIAKGQKAFLTGAAAAGAVTSAIKENTQEEE